MTQIIARDGQERWRVYFTGEVRDVWASNAERAVAVAESAQRITNAPKQSRRAYSVSRVAVEGPLTAFDPQPVRQQRAAA